jgi:hypothetical protein
MLKMLRESSMKVTKNIGLTDRLIRIGIGAVLIILAFFSSGWFALFFSLLALFCFFEGMMSWCLFYQLIGKNSCPVEKNKKFYPKEK